MSKTKKVLLVLLAIIICVGVYFIVVGIYNNNQKQNVEEAKEQKEEISNETLYTAENFPKIDASLATQPLTDAIYENFVGEDAEGKIDYSNTHPGYVKLINNEVDLIVVTEPSEEELALAKEKGVELEVIPVVKEGFVFYVNANNKIDSLTKEQIQKIYTGEIKNWKEVGGEDAEIIPYQRPVNSGSQTGMLSLVMKGYNLMEAPKENLIETMEAIINNVSSYENGKNSIGYSYYYYATTMFKTIDETVASNIKLLGIDGVKPNNQTIKDGSYPFTTAYYIVINKADDENSASRKLANQLLSARGQKVAEQAGYVPVK
ncbi:MAG: substrate-binding domain-containing protein [Clostridia bacterium]|nr:substrate-binding domain-containing protein [Clostridia bacterium]